MGSSAHPHMFLVKGAIARTLDNIRRNGGVVPAMAEARRLHLTYPDSGLSEDAIMREFLRQAAELHLPTDGESFRAAAVDGKRLSDPNP